MKRTCGLVVFVAFAAWSFAMLAARAQNTTALPAFEAASLRISVVSRPVPAGLPRMKGGPGTSDPGRVTWGRASLHQLLVRAWGVEDYQVVGPDWLVTGSPWYAFTATMPPQTTMQNFRLMLQNLLVERFQIKLHHETRTFPAYELVVAAGGSKLTKAANPDATEPETGPTGETFDAGGFMVLPPGRGQVDVMGADGVHLKYQNYTVAEFAESASLRGALKSFTGSVSHVIDKTGLAGKYDIAVKFSDPSGGGRGPVVGAQVNAPAPRAEDTGLPDLFRVIEKQLGLKLVKIKDFPLDTIVIDRAERTPVEN